MIKKNELNEELSTLQLIKCKADNMFHKLDICDSKEYLQDVLKTLEEQYKLLKL